MTTLVSYVAVQDCIGSPSSEWEAKFSESLGNNVDFLIYGGEFPSPTQVNVNYLDIQDAYGQPINIWFANTTSVDSGNNLQIYFNTPSIQNVQIYGYASVSSNSIRQRTSSGYFDAIGTVTSSANADYYANATVIGNGFLTAIAEKNISGNANINGYGYFSAIGKKVGEEWTNDPVGAEDWTDKDQSSTIWTNNNIGTNTWQ